MQEIIQKTGAPTAEELPAINRYTRREFTAGELYAFSVVLCDNDTDRDNERFTTAALHKLATLFVGKTGVFDHKATALGQSARIFACEVQADEARENPDGEAYCRLVARAYLPKSEKNADFILELESGMKKEVSVGCAVKQSNCSICGAKAGDCAHKKGLSYGGKTCCALLNDPTDAYEWSFVAVPAQREAGVIKSWGGEPHAEAELEKEAALGRRWRAELQERVRRLCLLAQPDMPPEVAGRLFLNAEADDLYALEKTFSRAAGRALPLSPQLAPDTEPTAPATADDSYKI